MENENKSGAQNAENGRRKLDFESILCAIVLMVMLSLVFLGVVSRKLLHFSFSFTEELVCAMFVLLGTAGSAIAVKMRSLYTLDLLTGALKPRAQVILFLITSTLTCIAAVFLTYCSFIMIRTQLMMGNVSVALRVPSWLYTLCVPFGLVLVIYRSVRNILFEIGHLKTMGKEEIEP